MATSTFKFKSVEVPHELRFFEPGLKGRGLNGGSGDMVTGAYDVFDRESGEFLGTVFKAVKLFMSFANLGSGFQEEISWVVQAEAVDGSLRSIVCASRNSAARQVRSALPA